jgi:hypothetical protein
MTYNVELVVSGVPCQQLSDWRTLTIVFPLDSSSTRHSKFLRFIRRQMMSSRVPAVEPSKCCKTRVPLLAAWKDDRIVRNPDADWLIDWPTACYFHFVLCHSWCGITIGSTFSKLQTHIRTCLRFSQSTRTKTTSFVLLQLRKQNTSVKPRIRSLVKTLSPLDAGSQRDTGFRLVNCLTAVYPQLTVFNVIASCIWFDRMREAFADNRL